MFKTLDDTTTAEIAQQFQVVDFEEGDTIIKEGQVGAKFYIVRSGSVEVLVNDRDNCEIKVATLEKGDCFGEMSLLTGEPTAANIKSAHYTELLTLSKEQFENLLLKYPAMNSYFHRLFVQRLRKANIEARKPS